MQETDKLQRAMVQVRTLPAAQPQQGAEHLDVLVVGAGISGIGAACQLTWQCPATSFVILEAQDGEVVDENGLARHIRVRSKIMRASWSSRDNLLTIEASRTDIGEVVHPQTWPDDLDCRGRRVVVIGSGATATLLPALARDRPHVTMLQRSPTFFRTGRAGIQIADELRALGIEKVGDELLADVRHG